MKKLTLDADALRVESFPVPAAGGDACGTVAACAATTTCPTFPLLQCPRSAFPTCGIQC